MRRAAWPLSSGSSAPRCTQTGRTEQGSWMPPFCVAPEGTSCAALMQPVEGMSAVKRQKCTQEYVSAVD